MGRRHFFSLRLGSSLCAWVSNAFFNQPVSLVAVSSMQGTANNADKFSVRADGLVTVYAGISVTAGGVTITSGGTNTFSTSAVGSPALTVSATEASGYTGSALSVTSGMVGAAGFYLIKVRG